MRARATAAILLAGLIAAAAAAPAGAAMPGEITGPEISMLVRSTIVALNQADLTGNYSVLRALGDWSFQAKYNDATLADMFRKFRDARINLAPAVLFDALLDAPPRLTTDGYLRITGHFPTQPQQIIFDAIYHHETGAWRIEALNVGLRPADVAEVPPPAPLEEQPAAEPPLPAAAPHASLPSYRLVGQRVLPWP